MAFLVKTTVEQTLWRATATTGKHTGQPFCIHPSDAVNDLGSLVFFLKREPTSIKKQEKQSPQAKLF